VAESSVPEERKGVDKAIPSVDRTRKTKTGTDSYSWKEVKAGTRSLVMGGEGTKKEEVELGLKMMTSEGNRRLKGIQMALVIQSLDVEEHNSSFFEVRKKTRRLSGLRPEVAVDAGNTRPE
jgi:hypothetical protein